MTHKATIDALETLLPEIRRNPTDVEGVLLKFASANNLATAQLGLLARKYNTARFLTHVKTSSKEATADTIPVLDVDALLQKYEQVPQKKQGYADLWTTPDSETDAGFLQFPFYPTEDTGMKEKSASFEEQTVPEEQLPYYQSILPLTEAIKSAEQIVYEVDEDIKGVLKKAANLNLTANSFIFGDDVKLAEGVFTGDVEYPEMSVIKEAAGVLAELKGLMDTRLEAERIKEAASKKKATTTNKNKNKNNNLPVVSGRRVGQEQATLDRADREADVASKNDWEKQQARDAAAAKAKALVDKYGPDPAAANADDWEKQQARDAAAAKAKALVDKYGPDPAVEAATKKDWEDQQARDAAQANVDEHASSIDAEAATKSDWEKQEARDAAKVKAEKELADLTERTLTTADIERGGNNLKEIAAVMEAGNAVSTKMRTTAETIYKKIKDTKGQMLLSGRDNLVRVRNSAHNKAKRETILMDLAMTDPVISQEDPENVTEYYNAIHALNPGITTHAALVRPILREAIQYGGIPLPTQKELARMTESSKA